MNWYLSKIVFRISASERPQFDEHLRLVQATSFEEAFLKARLIGISEEDSFMNVSNKPVKWEFVNVSEIIPLEELKDGVEVYSKIYEPEEAKAYIHYVHQKAATLQLIHSPAF